MIVGINGKIVNKNPPEVAVDVNGICYRILMPMIDFDKLGEVGDKASVHTQLFIKNETIEIYGFITSEEKELFLNLIKVHGLGPRSVLGILSQIESDKLIQAIQHDDIDRISMIKGIGKKRASKIIIEMKGKLVPKRSNNYTDAYHALQKLGLSAAEAKKRLEGIDDQLSVEKIIQKALKYG